VLDGIYISISLRLYNTTVWIPLILKLINVAYMDSVVVESNNNLTPRKTSLIRTGNINTEFKVSLRMVNVFIKVT
jgi:hypothetical protein